MYRGYIALINKSEKNNADYGVMFPDFPGCVFGGKSVDEALKNAKEGLAFHIEVLVDAEEVLPKPSTSSSALNKYGDNTVAFVFIYIYADYT